MGQLEIGSVDPVALETISAADARQAGYPSLAELLAEWRRGHKGEVCRIALAPLRPDPRLALRQETTFTAEEREALRTRLDRFAARAQAAPGPCGPSPCCSPILECAPAVSAAPSTSTRSPSSPVSAS